jgi:hypothetical protein
MSYEAILDLTTCLQRMVRSRLGLIACAARELRTLNNAESLYKDAPMYRLELPPSEQK